MELLVLAKIISTFKAIVTLSALFIVFLGFWTAIYGDKGGLK